jgi:hypothetical protein
LVDAGTIAASAQVSPPSLERKMTAVGVAVNAVPPTPGAAAVLVEELDAGLFEGGVLKPQLRPVIGIFRCGFWQEQFAEEVMIPWDALASRILARMKAQ